VENQTKEPNQTENDANAMEVHIKKESAGTT
jgi:hypothetical protein